MKLKVNHGIKYYDFKTGVFVVVTCIHLFSIKYNQGVISF